LSHERRSCRKSMGAFSELGFESSDMFDMAAP
jgi:hypothetical protein